MDTDFEEFKKLLRARLEKKRCLNKMDYVDLYANLLKNNNGIFKQQKMLIESQMKSSRSFFKNAFAGKDFKKAAREYLKVVGKI